MECQSAHPIMRAKSQEPRAKSQEPRAKSQEPRAKSQEPRATPALLNHRRPSTFSGSCLWCGRTLLSAVFALASLVVLTGGNALAQGDDPEEPCPGGGYNPTPTEVAVTAVPIVVASTTADYFVLYVQHELYADTTVELPVAVTLGEEGTTTLAENVEALPAERYRVEKYLIANPADVDGDCIDDITELADPVGMNPMNPAAAIELTDGAVVIPDLNTFEAFSRDSGGKLHVKFVLLGMDTDRPGIYFMNTEKYYAHALFLDAFDLNGVISGAIVYDPELVASDGNRGAYYYWVLITGDFYSLAVRSYTLLAVNMPLLDDNLAYYVPHDLLQYLQSPLALLRESRINLVFDEDIFPETRYLALNPGEGYGRLQVMEPDERPHPRDVVIYEALPNELPRVAGIVSTVPQTPLSHVNLRAIQDGIPNAFIRDALGDGDITALLGSYVHYTVTEDGWELQAATPEEVEAHYESSRPATAQTPQRDLSVTGITPLSEIGFEDWRTFGVKAANVAVLGTLGFPEGTVPDGFAIPFYFYDEFMKAHGFYDDVRDMLADEEFQTDFETQDDRLDDLRDDIKDAESPQWIIDALTAMHATFPEGTSLRYRSSTNNEDLPGFNGAGLYDSKTQDSDETEEDGIDKSFKQVLASLWTFRAFTERAFNRVDHTAAAMGVLVHPNYSDELANGVAVSFDPTLGGGNLNRDSRYYINTQVGEDLVTNPEANSIPEELLLYRDIAATYTVLRTSNQVPPGRLLLSDAQLEQLRGHLTAIHDHFKSLYDPGSDEPFAMEIEFKITSDDVLAIKQARPWVFEGASASPPPSSSPPPPPPPSGGGGFGGGGGSRTTSPSAPRNLTAVVGDGQVVLSWDAPESDGGAEITDYEYRINGRNPWISTGSTNTTHTVTGLVNGTEYTFQVRAVNRVGKSRLPNQTEAAPEAPEVFTLDFAHFANGTSITSDLVFVNLSTQPAWPAIYFYDTEGVLVSAESVVEVTGDLEIAEDGGLTVQTQMEPLGVLTISTHGQGALVSGSVKVVSDGPIGGGLRYNLPGIGEAVVGASPPVSDALFPARQQAGGIRTAAALHNLGEEPMEVSCRLMSGGAVLEEVEIPLEANGQTSWFIDEAFPAADRSDFLGSVHCATFGRSGFTGLAVEIDAVNRIFTTLPVVPVDRGGGGREAALDFAHFANGDGTTSDLVFVNMKTQPSGPAPTPFHVAIPPIRPVLYFYDKEGNPIAAESVVEVTGDLEIAEDGGLTVQTQMQPLGVLTISTHGQGDLVSGSVKVLSDGPIGGMLRYNLPAIGEAVVGASPPVSDALFPVRRQQGGITTGVAIHNLESSPGLVRCELLREGVLLDTVSIPLEANGQTSWLIDTAFPNTDTSDFMGSVRCDAVGEDLFSAVALEMDPGTRIFISLPVFPVPERMSQE